MAHILGISCSLRNARFGAGSDKLVAELQSIQDEAALIEYLEFQTKIRVEDFLHAGREDGLPFDELYRNLTKAKGDRGLSNSEASLAAGLWGALQCGAEISHLGLSKHFPKSGGTKDLDKLRECILAADALMISGPVYFGDRSSLAQNLIEFLNNDQACMDHLKGRVYAGISVGAKRNGGQETTLIYQMVDLTNMSMLAVGNDDKTTSQYGGTAKAGDVGTLYSDEYGITTSIGTGKRLATVANMMESTSGRSLNNDVSIAIWLLQDTQDHHGRQIIEKMARDVEDKIDGVKFRIHDFTQETIQRCIGCDICPTSVGRIDEYRCIIKSKDDAFVKHHEELISSDAVMLAAYSPIDRRQLNSVYQQFIERTRYLRRDDYALGDRLSAPLVISEVGSNQNLHIRMMTSLIRHQHIIHHPVIAMEWNGEILNTDQVMSNAMSFAETTKKIVVGRLASPLHDDSDKLYNPVGYHISMEKRAQDMARGNLDDAKHDRTERRKAERDRRLA